MRCANTLPKASWHRGTLTGQSTTQIIHQSRGAMGRGGSTASRCNKAVIQQWPGRNEWRQCQDRKGTQYSGVPLVRHMRLTFAYHPVTDIRFGATTQLQGTTLEVSEAALRQYLLEDRRLQRVHLAIVHPGEACRFGVVFDIVE